MSVKLNSRILIAAGLTAMASVSFAQVPIPSIGAKLHVDYTTTGDFTLKSGSTGHLSGPEIGVEFPLSKAGTGTSLNLYPSVLLGNSKGASATKGQVWRFMLSARQNMPGTGFYTFAAAGASYTQSQGGTFNDVNAFETQVGGGLPLTGLLGHLSPSLEVIYHNANKGQLRGFSAGVSVNF